MVLKQVLPELNQADFIAQIYSDNFLEKEWKDRMIHVTDVLHLSMPKQFEAAVPKLTKLISILQQSQERGESLAYIFLAEYIARYGINDIERSIIALECTTQFISCEFAVRPFIIKYPDQMLHQMLLWSKHPSHKVRRFSSEGSRPKLPWSMALPQLQKDPSPTFKILQNLMQDPHPWVRKSVANHLNDISKDHPDKVMAFAEQWKGMSKETDAIIKHGLRTLLKSGYPQTLSYYELNDTGIELEGFVISTPVVTIGNALCFSFEIENQNTNAKTIRLEYGLYYQKANGQLNKKVFKISEREFKPLEKSKIQRNQSFKIITTRKFHTGLHQLSLLINGIESEKLSFQLVE
ncbi:DNA alkylation repair protein [Flavobacterium sp. HSC-61S13]|uniref:DNA alkylation repair protein n=1 Tax=Flavobacterium sp. HSC-61S13 TaxID=2910963 RepID=UPI00209F6E55|nr:DNA alkylation repair protein [Flavobacterium sp. HSC-61S13]MCP1996834.1 3-methyladenine DNA glycosylase AlkC [Flavobacterium sp. HSC-61S13]